MIVPAVRDIAGVTPAGLARAAGCSTKLVVAIELGNIAPTCETAERLANAVHLELRMGPEAMPDLPAHIRSQFDANLDRVRDALDAEIAFRARFGVGPPAPLPATVAPWDGTDPAPARMSSAWPRRTDFGGPAALALRYTRNVISHCSAETLAAAAGVATALVRDLEAGTTTLSMDDTESILNAIGVDMRARLEPYETHDDELHLAALAEPRRTLKRLTRSSAVAPAQTETANWPTRRLFENQPSGD